MKTLQVTVLGSFVALMVLYIPGGKCQGSRYIERQLLCALDQAPCDVLGQQVKDALPEIIGKGCENCDRGQINNARRIARFVQTRYPVAWAALVDKYSEKDDDVSTDIEDPNRSENNLELQEIERPRGPQRLQYGPQQYYEATGQQ